MKSPSHSSPARSVHATLIFIGLYLGDLLAVFLSSSIAYYLRFDSPTLSAHYEWLTIVACVIGLLILPERSNQDSPGWRITNPLMTSLIRAAFYEAIGVIAFLFLTKTSSEYSRIWLVTWFLLFPLTLVAFRVIAFTFIRKLPKKFKIVTRVTLIGRSESCLRVALSLRQGRSDIVISEVWVTDKGPTTVLDGISGVKSRLFEPELFYKSIATEVWICAPLSDGAMVESILKAIGYSPANVRIIPDMSDFVLINYSVTNIAGLAAISVASSPMNGFARIIKFIEDRVLAVAFLIVALPVMLMVALGIKLSSPGPVLYLQQRVGWNGKIFNIMKFRSMPVDAERQGVMWGNSDKKVTSRFGQFIRKTSLDELPQLINVIKGDMSLVGPRPERPEFVDQFKKDIPGYMQKHLVKAGITGWAQLNGLRGDTDLNRRIEYDLYYVENWSLWFDIKILIMTVLSIMIRRL